MDVSQISFKISGSAGNASKSLSTLITRLGQLDASFVKATSSGNATIGMLNGVSGALSGGMTQATAYKTAMAGLATSLKSVNTTSRGVKLPTAKIVQQTTATKSATVATTKHTKETNKLNASLSILGSNSNHTMGSLGRMVRTLSQLAFVTIMTRQVFTGLITGFNSAIAYMENLNLFMVALGENTTKATEFIKDMSDAFYLDEAQLTRTQGLFFQISESLGLTSEKAYTLSENFTKLAYDLASFYNITVSDAVTKLQAGLVGETEPLRRIGIIITENNLAETARNLGIKKSIRNMTEQEKIQLRYVTALKQTQNAQSDLARTMVQPENLLRIFNEQWQILIRNLGSSFIPMLQRVMPHVIGLTKALADMAEQYAKMRGYIAPMVRDDLGGYSKVVADESEKQAKSTSKTAKELAKVLKYTRDISSATTGIDELNILGEQGGTAFDIGNLFDSDDAQSLKDSIDIPLGDYNNKINEARGTFDEFVKMYDEKLRKLWATFTDSGSFKAFIDLRDTIKSMFDGMDISPWKTLDEIVEGILTAFKDILVFGESIYNTVFKPIMELIAPDWMRSLVDGRKGSFAQAVSLITKAFVAWKAIKLAVGVVTAIEKLITLGGLVGGKTGLLALFVAMSAITLTLDVKDALVDGDFTELTDKIKKGLVAGLLVGGLTGSFKGAVLAFSIATTFSMAIEDITVAIGTVMIRIIDELLIKPFEAIVNFIVDRLNDFLRVMNVIIPGSKWDNKLLPHLDTRKLFEKQTAEEEKPSQVKVSWLGYGDRYNTTTGQKVPVQIPYQYASAEQRAQSSTPEAKVVDQDVANLAGYSKATSETLKGVEVATKQTSGYLEELARKPSKIDLAWVVSGEAYNRITGEIERYAKGGSPTKGELFVAGEKGPELVTEHKGQTVVMNEKQLKERGISLFAKGVNVPKWTKDEMVNATNYASPRYVPKWSQGELDSVYDANRPQGFKELLDAMLTIGKTTKDIYKKAKDSIFGKVFTATIKGLGKAIPALYGVYKTDAVTFSERSVAGGPTADQKSMALGAMSQIPYLGQVIGVLDAIESGAVLDFFTNLPNFIEAGMSGFQELLDGVIEALPAILEQIPVIITKIAEMFSNRDTLNKMIDSAIRIVMAIVDAMPAIIEALSEAIPMIVVALIGAFLENIPQFLKLGWNIGVAIVEGLANVVVAGLNTVIAVAEAPLRWLGVRFDRVPNVNLSFLKMADGGFVGQGQMFIAREAGAELIGNVGGRTAVMNNDQIVESVSRGVYEAMMSAQQSDRGTVVVNLDGRKISNNQRRVSRTVGLDFGLGGF